MKQFVMLCLVPSQPPENVNAMAVTSQSILVLWNPPPSSDQNGVLIGYKILYRVVRDDEGRPTYRVYTSCVAAFLYCL